MMGAESTAANAATTGVPNLGDQPTAVPAGRSGPSDPAPKTGPTESRSPWSVRAFRFQWPADLATSWAFEMELLILGWYILAETGSVKLLAAYGALQFIGTLFSPLFGVMGDRFGARLVLTCMRATYASLAATMMVFALAGVLDPVKVFILATLLGLVRPSDNAMRHALIGANMPGPLMMGGMSIARTTMDTAKIFGALAGASLADALGIGNTYIFVAAFYGISALLTLGVRPPAELALAEAAERAGGDAADDSRPPPIRQSPWRDVMDSVGYVRANPPILASMAMAFVTNATAWPLMNGMLPYVAREIYGIDRTGLGYLVAIMATGMLVGSLILSRGVFKVPPGRTMVVSGAVWHLLLLAYGWNASMAVGLVLLFGIGLMASFCMVPLIVMLARLTDAGFRGRVMGVRMLMVYGQPFALLGAGPLVDWLGFGLATTPYFVIGLVSAVVIGWVWRDAVWSLESPANAR